VCTVQLTPTQVKRLREQPYVEQVELATVYKPCETRTAETTVLPGNPEPRSWCIFLSAAPTKYQRYALYLLGASENDLEGGALVYEVALTPTQVERLRTRTWVNQVVESVRFHTCDPSTGAAEAAEMDASKIDSSLQAALQNRQHPDSATIEVYLETQSVPSEQEAELLRSLGVKIAHSGVYRFTGTLSQNQVKALSLQSFVKSLAVAGSSRRD